MLKRRIPRIERLREHIPDLRVAALHVTVAIVAQFLPLTGELHYEFSALCALTASLVAGLSSALRYGRRPELQRDVAGSIRSLVARAVLFSLIPLAVPLLLSLFVHSCGVGEGLAWYLLLVPPSAFIGSLLGIVAAVLTPGRRLRIILFLALWSVSLFRGAHEAYHGPHIYLYAWQVGFFPGGSWDAELPITGTLIIYRLGHLLIAGALALLLVEIARRRSSTPDEPATGINRPALAVAGLCAVIAVALIPFRSELGLTRTDGWLREELGDSLGTRFAVIHYARGSADSIDLWRAANLTDFHIAEHARALGIPEGGIEPVTLYLFGSPEEQKRYVGTGSASFTKPWRRMLCQTFERIEGTLRHELAHVMLARFGNPLGVSTSQGLLEGSAMALENDAGPLTLHETVRELRRHGMAPSPSEIIGVGGFSSRRASVSYILSGSFSRWLIDSYGMKKYLKAFPWSDFEGAYGVSAEVLSRRYEAFIDSLPRVDSLPLAAMRYMFGGGSFFEQKCLRRIGTLNGRGDEALAEQRYGEALNLYRESMEEGISYGARGGILRALIGMGRFAWMLDSCRVYAADTASYPLLPFLIEQGDAHWALGDSLSARGAYDSALTLRLGGSTATRAGLRRYFLEEAQPPIADIMREYFTRPAGPMQRLMILNMAYGSASDPVDRLLIALMRAVLIAPSLPVTSIGGISEREIAIIDSVHAGRYAADSSRIMRGGASQIALRSDRAAMIVESLALNLHHAAIYARLTGHRDPQSDAIERIAAGRGSLTSSPAGSRLYETERRIEADRFRKHLVWHSILP